MIVAPFLLWFIAAEAIGLAALPLAMAALPWLPDRGYGFARVLGLLLITYVNYLSGSIVPLGNNPLVLVIGMVVLCAIGLAALGPDRGQMADWLREQRTLILVQEVLFVVLFAIWTWVRAVHPAILSTEKPMDLALMTAAHKAPSFPAYDPWLAGQTINYYYGGYLAIGTLVTLTGVPAAVGYNLGVALLFALVGTTAYAVAYNLTRSLRWAALGFVFMLLIGNLDGLAQFFAIGPGKLSAFNFFNSSRVVEPKACGGNPCTITEFPAFSFLLGDLHPHVITLPFTILTIGIALNLALARLPGWYGLAPSVPRRVLALGLAGLAAGALYFMNSWDWPTYLLLIGAALLLPALPAPTGRTIGDALLLAVGVLVLSVVLYISFRLNFKPQYSSFGVRAHGSPSGDVFTMFGLFLLPVAAYIVTLLAEGVPAAAASQPAPPARQTARTSAASAPARSGKTAVPEREPDDTDGGDDLPRLPMPSLGDLSLSPPMAAVALIVCALIAWAVLAFVGLATVGLLFPFCCAALYLAWREGCAGHRSAAFALLLGAGGIGLIMLCDLVYLRDNFCGPSIGGQCAGALYRMNTVFKFYYQAWTVLALASAYGLYALAGYLRAGWERFIAPAGAVAITAAGGIYLLLGLFTPYINTYTTAGRPAAPTLDGSAYLSSYSGQPISITNAIPDDAAAIAWLRASVHGHPTILEANLVSGNPPGPQDYWPYPGDARQELMMSRISTFSGLPTVLGWGYSHEGLWHGDAVVAARFEAIQTLYTSTAPAVIGRLLRQYHVSYICVGQIESYLYYGNSRERTQAALERFKRFGRVVYNAKGVTILHTRF